MSGVYTKKGDGGTTSLLSGERVKKYDPRVEAYGAIDEAGVALGLARAGGAVSAELIYHIQQRLQPLCAELAGADISRLRAPITPEDTRLLEREIDAREEFLPRRAGFTIPVQNLASGFLHQARTIVRRAERRMTLAAESYQVRGEAAAFVNRLSDMFFILACEEEYIERVARTVKSVITKIGEDRAMSVPGEEVNGYIERLFEACTKKAEEIRVPMAMCVVDESGVLSAFRKMPGVLLASVEISQNKAYTAAALRMPTHELYAAAQPGGSLYGIETINGGKATVFGGGYPLMKNGVLIGALGISGGTVEEDMSVAEYALSQIIL